MPFEADIGDHTLVVHAHVELELIPAQRVVAVSTAIGIRQRPEVPRVAVVVEDDLLVEISEIRHEPNMSPTLPMAA